VAAVEPPPIEGLREQPKRRSKKRWIIGGLGIALVVSTFAFVLPKIASYKDVWKVVQAMSWWQILAVLVALAFNLVTSAPPWMAALPGLRFWPAFIVTQTSTASTYLAPGGAAVGLAVSYAMLGSWRFSRQSVTLAVAVTGAWNQFAMLGFPVVGLTLLTLTNEKNPLLQTVAIVGLLVFIVAAGAFAAGLSTPRIARWVGNKVAGMTSWGLKVIRRQPVSWDGESFVRFRSEAVGLLAARWHVITIGTLANQLTVFLLLLTCLRTLDVPSSQVTGIEAFAAWSVTRLLGSLPITPGGLGIVELGLTSMLVGFGGSNAGVVAAVLVYRFLSFVPTLILGSVLGALSRRRPPKIDLGAAADG
jgi:uncharacterized protein (TIRG00374 family)